MNHHAHCDHIFTPNFTFLAMIFLCSSTNVGDHFEMASNFSLYLFILRFVGTTPDSSNINDFLASVTLQIKKNYGEDSSIPEVRPFTVIWSVYKNLGKILVLSSYCDFNIDQENILCHKVTLSEWFTIGKCHKRRGTQSVPT